MTAGATLFDYGAERAAIASGRPKSQEKAELLHPEKAPDFGALWYCICGGVIGKKASGKCDRGCDA